MIVDKILDELEKQGNKKTPRLLYAQSLFFHTSILLNSTSGLVKSCNGKDIKFYGLSIASSGLGKDWSFNITDNLFNINEKNYANKMKQQLELNLTFQGYDQEESEKIMKACPRGKILGIEGTAEGIFDAAKAQSISGFGSINMVSTEIGDAVVGSEGLINKLKEIYEGKVLAKTTRSNNTESITDVQSNVLLFGSNDGFSKDSKAILSKILNSGFYRRSFIVNIESGTKIEPQRQNTNNFQEIREYIKQIKAQYIEDTKHMQEDYIFTSTREYNRRYEEINLELIKEANDNPIDKFKSYDSSAINLIESLAHIIAFLDSTKEVDTRHIDYAYEYFKETRHTLDELLYPNKLHIQMYQIIKLSEERLSYHDLAKYITDLPDAKSKRDELIELFEEYSFYKGFVPEITGNKVKYFHIREPEQTSLNKVIASLDITDYEANPRLEPKQAISFQEMDLSFFDNGKDNFSLEKVIQSKNVKSFCLSRFEESNEASKRSKTGIAGHRRADSYIEGFNIIGIDIDEGMTIEEAQELLSNYTYIIYTTRSHRKEKNGEIQGDRFRILIPIKQMIYVDPERYKKMYENIMDFLQIRNYDKATRNVSRLWFTNPDAEIYKNEAELLDVSALVPDTAKAEIMLPNINSIDDDYEAGRIDNRVAGFIKHILLNTSKGNRNDQLFRAKKFFQDLGMNYEHEVVKLNSMLMEPLSERELNNIIKRK